MTFQTEKEKEVQEGGVDEQPKSAAKIEEDKYIPNDTIISEFEHLQYVNAIVEMVYVTDSKVRFLHNIHL